ncbi:MAG: 16S rRNA (cytosine(1402)-N(4))-methyltransferase RsmH [Oscillospiraceae bacterium]|jgi:16S rRNA (cytosine1402-N4)-methyltransferase|nr:16S rRNA (cytosine(1402)-N(4))-methyltransferase RsmH [Oscillospiraceae bacterium]
MNNAYHVPVLHKEALDALNVKRDGVYVDCTLGGGGHSALILERLEGTGLLVGIDRDDDALAESSDRLAAHSNKRLLHGNFHDVKAILAGQGIAKVDGILADLGVSSHQLDTAERGFSYHGDAPLDMRMDASQGVCAAELVNTLSEAELARIFEKYGEERWSQRVAKFIALQRDKNPITTTGELVGIIDDAIPKAVRRRDSAHPARRVFQALRIAVNDELSPLENALRDCVDCLAPRGRLAVITFHSLEDRIVKNLFARMRRPCECPPSFPVCICGRRPIIGDSFRHAVPPSESEVRENSRSAGAKLRVAEKL